MSNEGTRILAANFTRILAANFLFWPPGPDLASHGNHLTFPYGSKRHSVPPKRMSFVIDVFDDGLVVIPLDEARRLGR